MTTIINGAALSEIEPQESNWRLLRILNGYRLLLALLLIAIHFSTFGSTLLGISHPQLFIGIAGLFLLSSVGFLLAALLRWPEFETQVYLQVYLDIIAITLLMHASGGIGGGLGMLLVVSIAGAGMLMSGRFALLFAALASLAILGEQLYRHSIAGRSVTEYPQAGILGATLFATAVLAVVLSRRSRESEELAEQRSLDLENMEQLNEQIIEQMAAGILVVDHQLRIRMANGSARQMLKLGSIDQQPMLQECAPRLAFSLADWRHYQSTQPLSIKEPGREEEIQPQFTPLGNQGWLIYLQDTSEVKRQLQQMKLASLGHLTASIAHEIRNPLGAISHAGQLLAESPDLVSGDQRLVKIVVDHCQRVNTIIEDVMKLSRQQPLSGEAIELNQSISDFATDFCVNEGWPKQQLQTCPFEEPQLVYMEFVHLHQVLWNLCCNSISHGNRNDIRIEIRSGRMEQTGHPYLDVCDNGSGVPPERIEKLFEPFYTSSHKGSGLGLFIARELCAFNGANLSYVPPAQGSRFRIVFNRDLKNGA